jgi:hypothetical protein
MRTPSDKDNKISDTAAKVGYGVGAVGGAGAFVHAARTAQKINIAEKMTGEYKRRLGLKQANLQRDFEPHRPGRYVGAKGNYKGKYTLYKPNSPQYTQAHNAFMKTLSADRKKHWSQVPELKKSYSRYSHKVAKLTGLDLQRRTGKKAGKAGTTDMVTGKAAGFRWRPKGIAALTAALFGGRARLPQFNLIGKLRRQGENYKKGGRVTVGGMSNTGGKHVSNTKLDPRYKFRNWDSKTKKWKT